MKLEDVFSDVLQEPSDVMSDDTSPKNLRSWDSARHIELVLAVESAFGVAFSAAEVTSIMSLGDMRGLLKGKGVAA